MESGYITLWRKFTDWEWYQDLETKSLFIHLLLTANHKDYKWKGIEIKKGQVVVGRKKLASEIGMTEQKIRTSLAHLKSTNEITSKSTNKYTVITVVNWAKYQNCEKNQPTNPQQINHQSTTNNNDNNSNINITNTCRVIIDYLNEVGKTNYKHTKNNYKYIIARLEEGFVIDNFKDVIFYKANTWLLGINDYGKKSDKDMSSYYRPETLFGNKFESYLEAYKKWEGVK